MTERRLTKKEYLIAINLYKSFYPNNGRFWAMALSLVGLSFFSILFIVSYFLENRSFLDSVYFSLMGPCFIGIIIIYNYILNWKNSNAQ